MKRLKDITFEDVREYIYDDYGIDIVQSWENFKEGKFLDFIKKFALTIFVLISSMLVSGTTLVFMIVYPATTACVVTSLIIGCCYIYYRIFIPGR